MKKIFLLFTSTFLILHAAFAQSPLVKKWDYRFGGTSEERLYSIEQTADGGFILGGLSMSDISGDKTQPNWDAFGSTADFFIVKIDSLGNKQWDKDFGGTDYDYFRSIQQTTDHGYMLGGWSQSGISGDKTQPCWGVGGDVDYWIVKTDSLGNKQWDKDFGGINGDGINAMQQTADGGYILGGSSGSGISGDKTQPNWAMSLS